MREYTTVQTGFKALGTFNFIRVGEGENADVLPLAVQKVLEIDDRLSVFKPASEITGINAAAGKRPVAINAATLRLLQTARLVSEASGGAFDITTEPLTRIWRASKKENTLPDKKEIERTRLLVDYRALLFYEKTGKVKLKRAGQKISLGGIAKGFAAAEVRRLFVQHGVRHALINLGGTVITLGTKPDGRLWNVGIQAPGAVAGTYMGALRTQDQAVVTAGSYERFFKKNGVLYHHILDPRTGYPAESGLLSVTVIGENAALLDALATAAFVLGIDASLPLLSKFHAQAIFIKQGGEVFSTQKQHHFSLLTKET